MRFFASKKRFIFSLSCLAVFGVAALVPNLALAQGFLGGIADSIGKAIGTIIAGFLLAIPSAILGIASLMLSQVIDPFFIRLPYTTGPIVDTGWVVVRDLANMLIVFFLIIIGLGTALRLGQYEAKKTLPKLIGVALLINFTPVITGFIVDVSNIFMNFFLEGVAGAGILGSIFTSIASGLSNDVPNFLNPVEAGGFILKILLIGIFEVFAAIVFFLFAALFIVRRVAIWILVILSPIAFVASVLPGTAGLFKMWWSQFFQWSIIGIFAAFFLWLGDQVISIAGQGTLVAQAPSENFAADMINEVMPFGIALAMLLVGFFVALQASGAMGAGVTKTFAMKGLAWSGATVGSALWRKAAWPGTKIAAIGSGLQQWGTEKGVIGKATVGALGWGIRNTGEFAAAPGTKIEGWGSKMQKWGISQVGVNVRGKKIPISPFMAAGWSVKNIGKAAASGGKEISKQIRFRDAEAHKQAAEKDIAKMGYSQDVLGTIDNELMKPATNWNRVLGLMNGLRNRGDANDIQDSLNKPDGIIYGKHALIGQLIKMGFDRIGPLGYRPLMKAFYGDIYNDPEKYGFRVDLERDAKGNSVRDAAGRVVFKDIEKDAEGNTVLDEKGNPKLKKGAKSSDAVFLEMNKTKIPARMTNEDFKSDEIAPSNYDTSTPEGQIFTQSMMIGRGAELIGLIMRKRDKVLRDGIIQFLNNLKEDWYVNNGAEDVLKYLASNSALNLGVSRIDPETGTQFTHQDIPRVELKVSEREIAVLEKKIAGILAKVPSKIEADLSSKDKEIFDKLTKQLKNQEVRRDHIKEAMSKSKPGSGPGGGTGAGAGSAA